MGDVVDAAVDGATAVTGGLAQHSMCHFFCKVSPVRKVQEECFRQNNCPEGGGHVENALRLLLRVRPGDTEQEDTPK